MALASETKASVGILLPMLIVGDLFAVAYYRRKAIWKHLLVLIPWVLIGIIIGFFVLDWSNNRILQVLIGVIVLILLFIHIVKSRLDERLEQMIDKARWFSPLLRSAGRFHYDDRQRCRRHHVHLFAFQTLG